MKTAINPSENTQKLSEPFNFQFKWATKTDSDCLKAWEEENEEYASWELENWRDEPAN